MDWNSSFLLQSLLNFEFGHLAKATFNAEGAFGFPPSMRAGPGLRQMVLLRPGHLYTSNLGDVLPFSGVHWYEISPLFCLSLELIGISSNAGSVLRYTAHASTSDANGTYFQAKYLSTP